MTRALHVLVAALLVATAACNRGEKEPQPRPEVREYLGPSGAGDRHPFGLKWDWSQIDVLSPYIVSGSGGTTFFEFAWCEIEPRAGERDWSNVDRVVRNATRLGYRINLKLRVGSCWATGDANPPRNQHRVASSLPKDLFLYSNFVSEAVERYSRRGVGDFAFENEVNARNFWRGSVRDYRRLFETAALAAHEASPDIRVFDAGLNSPAWGVIVANELYEQGDRSEALAFYQRYFDRREGASGGVYQPAGSEVALKRVLDSGPVQRAVEFFGVTRDLIKEGAIDALQLHYYDPWKELPRVMRFLRDEIGDDVPIEAWEAGVAWPGEDYDPKQHARETLQLFAVMLSEGIRRALYLPVSFSPGRARDAEVVRPLVSYEDGAAFPAGETYAALVDGVRGATEWKEVSRGGITGLAFARGGETTLVAWSTDGDPVTTEDGFKITDPGVFKSRRALNDVVARP